MRFYFILIFQYQIIVLFLYIKDAYVVIRFKSNRKPIFTKGQQYLNHIKLEIFFNGFDKLNFLKQYTLFQLKN